MATSKAQIKREKDYVVLEKLDRVLKNGISGFETAKDLGLLEDLRSILEADIQGIRGRGKNIRQGETVNSPRIAELQEAGLMIDAFIKGFLAADTLTKLHDFVVDYIVRRQNRRKTIAKAAQSALGEKLRSGEGEHIKTVRSQNLATARKIRATVTKEVIERTGLKCLHCQSVNIVRNGHQNGHQNYLCRDCGKTFSEATPKKSECIFCHQETVVKNGRRGGQQNYLCKNCGKSFKVDI